MRTRVGSSFWSCFVFMLISSLAMTGSGCGDGDHCYQFPCGPPISAAGEDQVVPVGTTVLLRGEVRLPPEDSEVCTVEKETLLFEWAQVSGPDVELTGAASRESSFVPTQTVEYKFRFRAIYPKGEFNCEDRQSQWDTVTITVVDVTCDPPVADAGQDQDVAAPQGTPVSVTLDGTQSHTANQTGCDLTLIRYSWTVVSEPTGSAVVIQDASQVHATVLLSFPGDYEFQLEVQDDGGTNGRTDTATDAMDVTLQEEVVCQPVADAGPDQSITTTPGTPLTVTLDGSTSQPDSGCPGSTLVRYAWTVISEPAGSSIAIQNPNSVQASVDVSVFGQYVFLLEVEDSQGGTDNDGLLVSLAEESLCGPPVVGAGSDLQAVVGDTVVLRASLQLPPEDEAVCQIEKESVFFEWEQMIGPSVVLQDADQREASFVPVQAGTYRFRCRAVYPVTVVNREVQYSLWDTVDVSVDPIICDSPVADAGLDQILGTSPGTPVTVTLDGAGSHPANQPVCGLSLIGYAWTVVSQPGGSNVNIQSDDQVQASVNLSVFGVYEFQLQVQDDGGTVGRLDTDVDTVEVNLRQHTGCPADLDVEVLDSRSRQPLLGAHVTVVDAAGASHLADTDASGTASFNGLAAGIRRSITAVSDDTVPPLPGVGADRPRYETTTVLDHCASEITIPLRHTASGNAARPSGTVFAYTPDSLFSMLPHSWRCSGGCTTDNDCMQEYYCEMDVNTPCEGQCTPRSLLPFFSLGNPYISGQFRFAMLLPVLPEPNFTYRDMDAIFAPPPPGSVWPTNLATDDTFLNELPYFGPLRRISLEVPAGQNVDLVLLTGIMDITMAEFLQVMIDRLLGIPFGPEDATTVLASMQMRTLHVCTLSADVAAGSNTDLTGALLSLDSGDCWNVDYSQTETTVALKRSTTINPWPCSPGDCGWPNSDEMCLPDPDDPQNTYCFTPLFRVEVISGDEVEVLPDLTDFDPTAPDADARLCSWLPGSATFEQLCSTASPGVYMHCDPPIYHNLQVPPDAECSFTFGMALAALDVPAGHADLPGGGRVIVGIDFNRCHFHDRQKATFLVPSTVLDGSVFFSVVGMSFRNLLRTDLGPFWEMPGYTAVQDRWTSLFASSSLPSMLGLPALDPPPADSGLSMQITFIAEDPTVFPPVLLRTYATALGQMMPSAGVHDLVYDLTEAGLPSELKGAVLSRVDYAAAVTLVDPWWRVYAPPGTNSFSLPAGASPFASGDEVWITPFGCGLEVPFDYDLFPTDVLLGPFSRYSEDSYAVIVP